MDKFIVLFLYRGEVRNMENQLAQIEQLEELDAPGWGEWVAGIGVGAVVGGGLVYGGIAIGVAIT